MRRVLYVSKPIVPPFHDGAKCLVRDVATRLTRSRALVLTTRGAAALPPPVEAEPLYPGAGGFAPALSDNARVLARLLFGARPDLWHFVFAPNPASSSAGKFAKALRRVPTVQTVASAPRSFDGVGRLLFGDRIVVLSKWMRERLVSSGAPAERIRLIPPPVSVEPPSQRSIDDLRAALHLPSDVPVLTYPGDIERSSGARMVASAVAAVVAKVPDAVFVFACRKKTARAEEAEQLLHRDLAASGLGASVRFAGEVASLPALLALSRGVLFPVDDLYGKVDLPIALLEAMALGVPIVALDEGPLVELGGAVLIPRAAEALAGAAIELLSNETRRRELGQAGRAAAESRHAPDVVARAYEAVYDELVP